MAPTEVALPMFPLSTVLFPGAVLPLHVFEPRYRALMSDCLEAEGTFGVVLISRGSEVGGGDQRVDIGTEALVTDVHRLGGGRLAVLARGGRRLRVTRWLAEVPYPRAVAEVIEPPAPAGGAPRAGQTEAVEAARRAVVLVRSLLSELTEAQPLPHDVELPADPDEAGWALCALAPLDLFDRQRLLAAPAVSERLDLLVELCTAMADDVAAMLGQHGAG